VLPVVRDGYDYLVPELGIVHVVRSYASGAAIVMSPDGTRWLVDADTMRRAEMCLFTQET